MRNLWDYIKATKGARLDTLRTLIRILIIPLFFSCRRLLKTALISLYFRRPHAVKFLNGNPALVVIHHRGDGGNLLFGL